MVYNHGQKQLRYSSKKTRFIEWVCFSISNLTFRLLSPFQCCNHVTVSTERISTLKRGRGGFGYQQKRYFLKLWKDADRKRLFCSNVSTLLFMIVALCCPPPPNLSPYTSDITITSPCSSFKYLSINLPNTFITEHFISFVYIVHVT